MSTIKELFSHQEIDQIYKSANKSGSIEYVFYDFTIHGTAIRAPEEKNIRLSCVSDTKGHVYYINHTIDDDHSATLDMNRIYLKTKHDMYSKFRTLLPFLFERSKLYIEKTESFDSVFNKLNCNYPLSANVYFYDYDIITGGDGKGNIRPMLVAIRN